MPFECPALHLNTVISRSHKIFSKINTQPKDLREMRELGAAFKWKKLNLSATALDRKLKNQVYNKVGCKQRAKTCCSPEISHFEEQLWTHHRVPFHLDSLLIWSPLIFWPLLTFTPQHRAPRPPGAELRPPFRDPWSHPPLQECEASSLHTSTSHLSQPTICCSALVVMVLEGGGALLASHQANTIQFKIFVGGHRREEGGSGSPPSSNHSHKLGKHRFGD